ncbi:hypothetical protein KCV06_g9718, partial [Aureobasidium melanogenum]
MSEEYASISFEEDSKEVPTANLHGASSESNIDYPRGYNASVYPVNGLVKTGSKKQKLLPNTHEGLLSSATQHQTLYRQSEIPPSLHEGSDKLVMGRTMISLGAGGTVRSSKMSDLSKGGLNSSKVTDARGAGRSGQYLPARSTRVTPQNSSTQTLCQDVQPGSYANPKPSVPSVPQPLLDQNFPGKFPQHDGGLQTKLPTTPEDSVLRYARPLSTSTPLRPPPSPPHHIGDPVNWPLAQSVSFQGASKRNVSLSSSRLKSAGNNHQLSTVASAPPIQYASIEGFTTAD